MSASNRHISQQEWELIEAYLDNQLSPEQADTLQKQVNTDPAFAEKVREVRSIMLGIREAALAQQLKDWHPSTEETPVIPISGSAPANNRKRQLAAACILLLVLSGAWLLFKPSKAEKIFAEFYKPDPGLATVMALSEHYTFEKAMIDYKSGSYEKALIAWKELLVQHPDSDTLNFFIGNAYLAKGTADQAIPFLEKVTADPQSIFRADAAWYLCLALLKEDRPEEVVKYIDLADHERKDALKKKIQDL